MRILSGIQPTGFMHLGNYIGAIQNWVRLQEDPKNELYYFVADLHSLTSNQAGYREQTNKYTDNMVIDMLAAGIDLSRATLFLQSDVPEHAELHTLLSMVTPVSWLERNPTYKEKMDEIKGKDLDNLGFLSYPVLMTADIVLYKATHVPVGKDQIPHLEIGREIVRRFNYIYGKEVLIEPQPLLAPVAKLNGLDGRKMSKSYDNAVFLNDSSEDVRKKVMTMITDVKRAFRKDPGHPDECNLFPYYLAFCKDQEFIGKVRHDCEAATLGCVDDKKQLVTVLDAYFADFRAKREELAKKPDFVNDILREGAKKARVIAKATMEEVREAIGMSSSRRYEA
jgi:tryptophanyl-tRNA synthetase